MKKTLTVNLNGRVFHIDEDAYELLENYLRNLRHYFRKEEGSNEIIADFEARIEELFSERINTGSQVITIEHVESVIKQMGQPEDFGDKQPEEPQEKAKQTGEERKNWEERKTTRKKFYRDEDDKMLGGVCSGIAAYFGWDVLAVRIIVLVLTGASSLGLFPIYIILWILVPTAKTAEQKLEMRGEEVTLENIGKTVASGTNTIAKQSSGCLGWFLDFIVSLVKIFLVGLGILVGIPLIFALFITLIVLFAVIFGVGGGLLAMLPFSGFLGLDVINITSTHPTLGMIALILVIAIPLLSLLYWIIARIAGLSPIPKSVKVTSTIAWFIALALLIYSLLTIDLGSIRFNENYRGGRWFGFCNTIQGNNIITNRSEAVSEFDVIRINDGLASNLQLEQTTSDSCRIQINGDSNLIDKITCSSGNGTLRIGIEDDWCLKSHNEFFITVYTPGVKGIEINSAGRIKVNRKVNPEHFFVNLSGAGSFEADSLYCDSFSGEVNGVGTLNLTGKTRTSRLRVDGAGRIQALNLESDEVNAGIDGVGSIHCNPLKRLEARVDGVGSIRYKNEPEARIIHSKGIGSVSKN